MQAIVVENPNTIRYKDIPLPKIKSDEALIKLIYTAICSTDFSIIEGHHRNVSYPIVPGHEWIGIVAKVSDENYQHLLGKRVVAENFITCGYCRACRNGAWNLCPNYKEIGFNINGGYAEYLVTKINNIHELPDSMSDESAVLIEPTAVVVYCLHKVGVELGDKVIVFGDGPIGLLVIQTAISMGAKEVAVVGGQDYRLKLCEKFGAGRTFNYKYVNNNLIHIVLTEFGLADIVIEASGSVVAFQNALDVVQLGGKICLAGDYGEKQCLIVPNTILEKNITVVGTTASPGTWSRSIDLIQSGKIDTASLVTHRMKLSDYQKALDLVKHPQNNLVKCILVCSETK